MASKTQDELTKFFDDVEKFPGGFLLLSKMMTLASKNNIDLIEEANNASFKKGFEFGIDLAKELVDSGEFKFKEGNAGK